MFAPQLLIVFAGRLLQRRIAEEEIELMWRIVLEYGNCSRFYANVFLMLSMIVDSVIPRFATVAFSGGLERFLLSCSFSFAKLAAAFGRSR